MTAATVRVPSGRALLRGRVAVLSDHVAALRGRAARARGTLLRPGARLTVQPGGRVQVTGRLDLGPAWEAGRHYASHLVVRRGGLVRVTGHMAVHTDFRMWVNEGATLTLGSGFINNGLNLSCFSSITIGDGCAIGERVLIRDSDDHVLTGGSGPTAPVRIGDGVWIGSGATVLRGVTIGDGAVVAAGAVVTRDVPARCLAAGVPARVIRRDVEWH